MWWHREKNDDKARAVNERSKRNAVAGEQARAESARLAAEARPIQGAIREQWETNHWAELIFGRLN